MAVQPNDLMLFARVVDEGSFSRAAVRVGLPKSTVSRRIAWLESQLGERLLQRTTRKLTVTDFGHSVLEHARQVAAEVEATAALAQHRQLKPSGRLRISMAADFANAFLGDVLARFIAAHPAITLEADLTPRHVDLVGENFDLAIRMGELPTEPALVARRIATLPVSLYAAPAYLKRRGMPAQPAELMQHDALHLLMRSGEAMHWLLSCDEQRWEGLPPARATANSPELLTRLALAGTGIAAVADHLASPLVQRGDLVPVLPQWALPAPAAWAVYPGRRLMPARTRVFLDTLEAEFSSQACKKVEAQYTAERKARASAGKRVTADDAA